jgi:hypothetical protein
MLSGNCVSTIAVAMPLKTNGTAMTLYASASCESGDVMTAGSIAERR